jgi:septum formation protein
VIFRPAVHAPLWLASRSERRRRLLDAAGVPVRIRPAGVDDGRLRPGRAPAPHWVMSLAYFKARWVADALAADPDGPDGTVLGADTVCVHGGVILGQPAGDDDARGMLRALRASTHVTMTGVCFITCDDRRRWLLVDRAVVRFGALDDDEIDRYVAAGAWKGKAGGYNLQERVDAGWPIVCEGDPATVMGLPMRRLEPWLAGLRRAAS